MEAAFVSFEPRYGIPISVPTDSPETARFLRSSFSSLYPGEMFNVETSSNSQEMVVTWMPATLAGYFIANELWNSLSRTWNNWGERF